MNALLICNQVSFCMVNLLLINESHSWSVPWVNDNLLYQYSCLYSCRIKRKPVIATQSYMYNPLLIHKVYRQIWQEVVQLSLVNDYLVLSYHIHCPKQENHMSHFAYACKMRYPLNLVLKSWEYLWFYWTFCIVILDYGLKLHKLSNHILGMLQKWLEIH